MAAPDRAVVITGASTGIGAACALRLAQSGWRVFAGVRKAEAGEELKRRAGPTLEPLLLDVTDAATVSEAARRVTAALGSGGLAGLVNNAGIAAGGPLEFVPLAEFRRQFEVNVFGVLTVTQAFLPLLRAAPGRIVNMGSISGRIASPFLGPYCASKFALESLTDSLRLELRPHGVRVALVEPGAIATPIWEKSVRHGEEVERGYPLEAHALYGEGLAGIKAQIDEASRSAEPPTLVAAAVEHALCARRPRTRYVVGRDARLAALLHTLLPAGAWDALLTRQLSKAARRGTNRNLS
jgi:NAD(P)-dependent dehydrogenase (short-subunit alcohol dehydrogenase family)